MPAAPIIRPIRAEEAPEAKRLICTVAHQMMEPRMPFEAFLRSWESRGIFADLDDIQKNYLESGGAFLIAAVDGRMVGTGAIRRYAAGHYFVEGGELRSTDERLRTGEGLCEARRIAVLPEFRGQKLGYALMLDLLHRAREIGYARMVLWTNPVRLRRAVDFYHQLGFTDLPIDGLNADELWMGMDLYMTHPEFNNSR